MAQHRRCRTTTLQLVDQVPLADLALLRHALPAVQLVQVVHVRNQASVDEARRVAPWVNAVLLDSGNPPAPYGLDLCSSVRRHGRLEPQRLAAFFAAAHTQA